MSNPLSLWLSANAWAGAARSFWSAEDAPAADGDDQRDDPSDGALLDRGLSTPHPTGGTGGVALRDEPGAMPATGVAAVKRDLAVSCDSLIRSLAVMLLVPETVLWLIRQLGDGAFCRTHLPRPPSDQRGDHRAIPRHGGRLSRRHLESRRQPEHPGAARCDRRASAISGSSISAAARGVISGPFAILAMWSLGSTAAPSSWPWPTRCLAAKSGSRICWP